MLLGMECMYRGATVYNEPGIIVVCEPNPALRRLRVAFGWNLDTLQQPNLLTVVTASLIPAR